MAALAVRQVLPSSSPIQSGCQNLSSSQPPHGRFALIPCCRTYGKQAVTPWRTPRKFAGHLSRLEGLSAWGGRQFLGGGASEAVFHGLPQRGVSRRATRGLVSASLLGVGAPEALVIAVVALLVFGPKGLAEVARNVGKTLKTFQPTIKELQDVSREFRSTLEQEIGLDELRDPYRSPPPPPRQQALPPAPADPPAAETAAKPAASLEEDRPSPRAYTSEEMLRVTEEQAKKLVSEEKRKASEAAAWGGQVPKAKAEEGTAEKVAETEKVGSRKEPLS